MKQLTILYFLLCGLGVASPPVHGQTQADAMNGIRQVKVVASAVVQGSTKGCELNTSEVELAVTYVLANSRLRINPSARDILSISAIVVPLASETATIGCSVTVVGGFLASGDFTVRSTGRRVSNGSIEIWNMVWPGTMGVQDFKRLALENVEGLTKRFVVAWSSANP